MEIETGRVLSRARRVELMEKGFARKSETVEANRKVVGAWQLR
ncbi:hypothetical protein BCU13_010560 [Vibrio lentus]|nr:hypothetical protein [Vibrio lentus]